MVDKQLVYTIVRDHFQKEDCRQRQLKNCKHFNEYFYANCSPQDILCLTEETTQDGFYEIIKYTSYHLLSKYGLHTYSRPLSWNAIGRYYNWNNGTSYIDALTLPDADVIIDHYDIMQF